MKRLAALLRSVAAKLDPPNPPPAHRTFTDPPTVIRTRSMADEVNAMRMEYEAELAWAQQGRYRQTDDVKRIGAKAHGSLCNSQFGPSFPCNCGLANVEPVSRLTVVR